MQHRFCTLLAGYLLAAAMLSASAAHSQEIRCKNDPSDAGMFQAAIKRGGTVTVEGTCDFSRGGIVIDKPVVIQGSGPTPTIAGDGSNSGFAFTINVDGVTISGLTFDKAIGATHLTGRTRQHFTFTHNTVENTNGINAIQVDETIRYALIDSNTFYNIGVNGFPSSTYESLGFGGCYSLPNRCDIPGEAISITGGMDNTSITNNKADYIANNFLHADWHIIGAPPFYYLTTNNSVSYNTLVHVHRMGIELQGTTAWPNCGPDYKIKCDFSVPWTSNIKVAGNYFHTPFLAYQTYGYSLVFQGSGVEINNAAIAEHSTIAQAAQALENLGYGILAQGNVFTGEPFTNGGKVFQGWGSGIVYGYNGAIPGSLYTTQNNVLCSTTNNFGTENNGNGRYNAKALNQYNYINNTCPNAGHLMSSSIVLDFSGPKMSGANATWALSAISTLPVKWVQFFVDGSAAPVATQEIQDVNTNFANDQKWLYHATLDTTQLKGGGHKITATATDVSGATSSITRNVPSL